MRRPKLLVLIGGLAVAIALGPVLGATVLAADPTVVIRPGDTLTGISKRHGVPIKRLVQLNRIADPNRIFAGQWLRLASDRPARSTPASSPAGDHRVHVVTRGSTLSHIALRYGVSVSSIVAANGIADASRIFAGQRLTIPGTRVARGRNAPAAVKPRVHVVTRGSTLWHIARRYGVTVPAIVAANGIANPSHIFAGQRLTIPGARSASGSRSAGAIPPAMPASMARLVAERDSVRRLIVRAADRWSVPRSLALAVAWQESGFQRRVVSSAGAVGVMQLMPDTADWVGQVMLGARVHIHDTKSNVSAGVRLLRHYLDRYGGDRDRVLAAYYQGQRAVDRYGIYPISRPYIASIRHLERLFGD